MARRERPEAEAPIYSLNSDDLGALRTAAVQLDLSLLGPSDKGMARELAPVVEPKGRESGGGVDELDSLRRKLDDGDTAGKLWKGQVENSQEAVSLSERRRSPWSSCGSS